MADFEHEQLKSLFERLAEKLDKTAGDEEHLAMLTSLRNSINKLQQNLNKRPLNNTNSDGTVIQEFLKDWQGTLNDFKSKPGGPGGTKGTLLQEYANDALEETTKSQKRSQEQVKAVGEAFKKVKTNLTDFSKGLDGSVASLAGMVGLNQGAAGKMFGAIDENVEMYRNLRQTGEGSIDSIYGMRGAAQDFALTTKQFSEAIAKGSDGARQLGAIRFGDVNKRFRDATAAVGRFGLSIDDSITVQSTYMDMLRDQGNLNTMDNGAIAAGMEQLVKSSNITSSILGKTRDEVLKERAEVAKDNSLAVSLKGQGKTDEEIAAIVGQMAEIKQSMGVDAARAYRDTVTTGQVQGENAQKMSFSPEALAAITKAGRGARDGNMISSQDFFQGIKDISTNMSSERLQTIGALGSLGIGGMETSAEMTMAGFRVRPDNANELKETDAAIKTMSDLEETTAKLNAQFQEMIDKIMKPILLNVGPKLVSFLNGTTNMLAKLSESGWGLAAAVGVAIGGFALLKVGMGLLHTFIIKNLIGGLGRMLGGAAGRGAGSVGGRLLGGVAGRGAAAGAGGLASGALGTVAMVGGGVLAGGLGLFAGNRMVAHNAGESLMGDKEGEGGFLSSRAAGYGTSAASGALAGAAIGSVIPVLGTAIGAAIGGVVGLGAAGVQDYMSNRNRPENTVSPENRPRSQNRPPNAQPSEGAPVASGNSSRTTPEMINQRIATLTEAGNGHLRLILENNRAQLEAMRQEMAEARNFYAASLRLNEEVNRSLRQMGAVN